MEGGLHVTLLRNLLRNQMWWNKEEKKKSHNPVLKEIGKFVR